MKYLIDFLNILNKPVQARTEGENYLATFGVIALFLLAYGIYAEIKKRK